MEFGRKRKIYSALVVSVVFALLIVIVIAFPRSPMPIDCPRGQPPGNVTCPYIDAWIFMKSGVLQFEVVSHGQDGITFVSATISGLSNNTGFLGTVMFSLNNTKLSPNNAMEFMSPTLNNLQVGDHVTITVRCTNGAYYTTSELLA